VSSDSLSDLKRSLVKIGKVTLQLTNLLKDGGRPMMAMQWIMHSRNITVSYLSNYSSGHKVGEHNDQKCTYNYSTSTLKFITKTLLKFVYPLERF